MPQYIIPLRWGIGNILQSIPFANHMKKLYGEVFAMPYQCDYSQIIKVIEDVFDEVYSHVAQFKNGYKIAIMPEIESFPEHKAWFVNNNENMPKGFSTKNIKYESLIERHDVVIWPECKPNRPCKRWPYF